MKGISSKILSFLGIGLVIGLGLMYFIKPMLNSSPVISTQTGSTQTGVVATTNSGAKQTSSGTTSSGSIINEKVIYTLYVGAPISDTIPNGMVDLIKIDKEKKMITIYSFAYNLLIKNKKGVYSLVGGVYRKDLQDIFEKNLNIKITYLEDGLASKNGVFEYYKNLIEPNGYLITIDGQQKPIKNAGALLTYMTLAGFYDIEQLQTFQNNLIKTLWMSSLTNPQLRTLFQNSEITTILENTFKDTNMVFDEKKINIKQGDSKYIVGYDYDQRQGFAYESGEDEFWTLLQSVVK